MASPPDAQIRPLSGKLPKATYHWDPETDILSASCKGAGEPERDERGLTGTIDLEGTDGSFVVIDVADGRLRGVDIVSWPDDVRTVPSLDPPDDSKEGAVVFPSRRSQPGIAAVEVDTALTIEKNAAETVFHLRVGRSRPSRAVRVADAVLVEVDKQDRLAGIWFLDVPPFPDVEAGP